MFNTIKHWMRPLSTPIGDDQQVLVAWAGQAGHRVKTVVNRGDGIVIQTSWGSRVEWGPTQRPYFEGYELRFRCECGLEPDVQVLWVSKLLAQTLEGDVFKRFTDAMQTRIDSSLPDEMRWLATHPNVPLVNRAVLGQRFLLLSNAADKALQWLNPELLSALESAALSWWGDSIPIVMTVNRGILTLRMSGQGLQITQLERVGRLFDLAAIRLRAVADPATQGPRAV
jgi:hypothetical protein